MRVKRELITTNNLSFVVKVLVKKNTPNLMTYELGLKPLKPSNVSKPGQVKKERKKIPGQAGKFKKKQKRDKIFSILFVLSV